MLKSFADGRDRVSVRARAQDNKDRREVFKGWNRQLRMRRRGAVAE